MVDLVAREGDSFAESFRVLDADDDGISRPRPLGGATVSAIIRRGESKQADAAHDNFTAGVRDAVQGLVRIELPRTHALAAGVYWYEVDLETSGGQRDTIASGRLTVEPTLFAR